MVFSSIIFLCYFLPLFFLLYFIVKGKYKVVVLFTFSMIFYAWGEPKNIAVLMASILVNYVGALLIQNRRIKKVAFLSIIVLNLITLFVFKYLNFATTILSEGLSAYGISIEITNVTLPIGISFFTFQGMSYVIDVYRGTVEAQKNPIIVATYISMFPQLVAGPIVRYETIQYQFNKSFFNIDEIYDGMQKFIIGLSKKVLVADVLAKPVDMIMGELEQLTVSKAWIGVFCYTLQIYFDFSGYSDMAIGLGEMMGFHFPENFNHPYRAMSLTDFWRRWHITLSSWFKDYIYIPLGGSRRGNVCIHLLIVFLITGIWHGANYSFLLWGLWHGGFVIIERILKIKESSKNSIIMSVIRWISTMLVVMIGWVLFRCATVYDAFQYIVTMFGKSSDAFIQYSARYYLSNKVIAIIIISFIIISPLPEIVSKLVKHREWFIVIKNFYLVAMLCLCIMSIVNGDYSPFIYFQF